MKKSLNLTLVFTLAALIITILSCKDEERCSVHPEAFRFSITDRETGSDLISSGIYSEEDIGIYYFHDEEKQELIVNRETDPQGDHVELYSAQLPMISLTGRSDIFYMELAPGETDTLLVLVEKESRGECDYHPYTLVKHNGEDIPIVEGRAFILKK
ncbi:MAG: hypothetical protein ACLFQA_07745 [Bacteroidales bacterium]